MKYFRVIIPFLAFLLVSCEINTGTSADVQKEIQPKFTIVSSIAGQKNPAGIQRIIHSVKIDSAYSDSIESIILPGIVGSLDRGDRNMHQFFIYENEAISFEDNPKIEGKTILEVYGIAKEGSVALVNKSLADDGIVLYDY